MWYTTVCINHLSLSLSLSLSLCVCVCADSSGQCASERANSSAHFYQGAQILSPNSDPPKSFTISSPVHFYHISTAHPIVTHHVKCDGKKVVGHCRQTELCLWASWIENPPVNMYASPQEIRPAKQDKSRSSLL